VARDDAQVKPRGRPERPAWAEFTEREGVMFDYIMAEFVLPAVHGAPDGAMIVELAKVWSAYRDAMDEVSRSGVVVQINGKPVQSPYFVASIPLYDRMHKLMAVMGFTPVSRLRLAPPMGGGKGASSWDHVD
jgi:hypothetical protein